MTRSKRARTALVVSGALVVGGLLVAFLTRGADAGSSTVRANTPQPTMTTIAGRVATLDAPAARSAGDVLVNLTGVPGKTSILHVPEPGLMYDLYVACVTDPGDGAGSATAFEFTEGTAGAALSSGSIVCDGHEQWVFTGLVDGKLATASLTGKGTSGLRGYALLAEH